MEIYVSKRSKFPILKLHYKQKVLLNQQFLQIICVVNYIIISVLQLPFVNADKKQAHYRSFTQSPAYVSFLSLFHSPSLGA